MNKVELNLEKVDSIYNKLKNSDKKIKNMKTKKEVSKLIEEISNLEENELNEDFKKFSREEFQNLYKNFKNEFISLNINDNIFSDKDTKFNVKEDDNEDEMGELNANSSMILIDQNLINESEINIEKRNNFTPNLLLNSLCNILMDSSHILKHESNKPFNLINYIFAGLTSDENPTLFLNHSSKKLLEKLKKVINTNKLATTKKYKNVSESLMKSIMHYSTIDLNESFLVNLFIDVNNLFNENCKLIQTKNKSDFELFSLNWKNVFSKNNLNHDDKKEKFTYHNILNHKLKFILEKSIDDQSRFFNLIRDFEVFIPLIYLINRNSKNNFFNFNDEKTENILKNIFNFLKRFDKNKIKNKLKFDRNKYNTIKEDLESIFYFDQNYINESDIKKDIIDKITKKINPSLNDKNKIWFFLNFLMTLKLQNKLKFVPNENSKIKLFYDFYDNQKQNKHSKIIITNLLNENEKENIPEIKIRQIKKKSNIIKIDASQFLEENKNIRENNFKINDTIINNINNNYTENNFTTSLTNLNLNLNFSLNFNVNVNMIQKKQELEDKEITCNIMDGLNNENYMKRKRGRPKTLNKNSDNIIRNNNKNINLEKNENLNNMIKIDLKNENNIIEEIDDLNKTITESDHSIIDNNNLTKIDLIINEVEKEKTITTLISNKKEKKPKRKRKQKIENSILIFTIEKVNKKSFINDFIHLAPGVSNNYDLININ